MNIVKPSKTLNLQRLPKKQSSSLIHSISKFIPTMLLASLLGTYLDLFFVGKGLYTFPKRLFPEVFSINIAFTLFALPFFVAVFLYCCQKMNFWFKGVFILILSLLMSIIEKQAVGYGYFLHHESWKHFYSFCGYILFLIFIYSFYRWLNQR
ncbi:CBO0543 family protein [Bacillus sp. JJ722]|uniref:CBO0543 family protein n=1 Tax=Bacillus sp. JJ722 TaxID=3122973 RepID=UPI003F6897B0